MRQVTAAPRDLTETDVVRGDRQSIGANCAFKCQCLLMAGDSFVKEVLPHLRTRKQVPQQTAFGGECGTLKFSKCVAVEFCGLRPAPFGCRSGA